MASKLDAAVVDRAVNALFKYEAKKSDAGEKSRLIDSFAKPILVQVQLTKPVAQKILKPVRVKIPNSMFSPDDEEHSICLFVRSEDKAATEEYLAKNPFKGLTTILTINEVKKYHSAHKDKKKLLNEHTHFVSDARVVRQLYNILGSVFGSRNNYPVPVDIEKIDKLSSAVQKVIDSTYMAMAGQNITIRLGLTNMNQKHVIENVLEGLAFAVSKFKGEWKDVHSIHIKTHDSAALPIYSKIPNEMIQFIAKKAKTDAATPAKGKAKAVAAPVVEEKVSKKKAAAPVVEKSVDVLPAAPVTATKGKKSKAVEVVPPPAPVEEQPVAVTKGKKAVAKKEVKVVDEVVEEPVVAAAKTTKRKTAAPKEEAPVAATPLKRSKRGAAAAEPEEVEEPVAPSTRGKRTAAKK